MNTFWDGVFHSSTYVFLVAGLFILWRRAHRRHLYWSGKLLVATLLLGFGIFNCVEGLVDHQILGIHHVNELVDVGQRIYWDLAFLVWGAAMTAAGWALFKRGKADIDQAQIARAERSS